MRKLGRPGELHVPIVWLIVAIVAVCFIWAVASGVRQGQILAAQKAEFIATHEGWDVYVSPFNRGVIALSRDEGTVILGVLAAFKRYSLADIASVEVLRDGASITSTNRGSQAAGALVGGLAFGSAGMLLGGLSGSTRNTTTIHSIAIKAIVDDRESPVHIVQFFKSPSSKGTDARNSAIRHSIDAADRFHALLANALRGRNASPSPVPGCADEIRKLWELRQAGALSDEEFTRQKTRLLCGNDAPGLRSSVDGPPVLGAAAPGSGPKT